MVFGEAWLTGFSPEQKAQYASSTVTRNYEATERAKGWAHPLDLQEAKDAYRADSVSADLGCCLFGGLCGSKDESLI